MISHRLSDYINKKLAEKKWEAKYLAEISNIKASDISKYRKRAVKKLGAEVFYQIYSSFGDTCSKAAKSVYPQLDLRLKKYKPKERNSFGRYMKQYEESVNSIEEIAAKTGIDENRLKDLYFRKAALEAYELLLIEKAIGKKQGELFKEYFG
jgi:hypothetical protein